MKNQKIAKSWLDHIALIVSVLASPYAIAALTPFIVIWHFSPTILDWELWSSSWIIFALFVPLLFVWYGVRVHDITDIHVMKREQRLVPFIVTLASALALSAVIQEQGAPWQIVALAVSFVINTIALTIITGVTKISIHAASAAGSVIVLGVLFDKAFYWLFLLVPLVIWARERRHRHTWWQGIAAVVIVSFLTYAVLTWRSLLPMP